MALNIFFNVLYAFFNAFSFLVLMPMLEVLFGENRAVYTKPSFSSALNFKTYVSLKSHAMLVKTHSVLYSWSFH